MPWDIAHHREGWGQQKAKRGLTKTMNYLDPSIVL